MKLDRIMFILTVAFLFFICMIAPAFSQTPVWIQTPPTKRSTSTQVSCTGTATLIYSGPRQSLTIFNHSGASVAAYISPRSDVTTSNAGLQLSSTLMTFYIDDKGQDDWYCITAGSTATIGLTVRP